MSNLDGVTGDARKRIEALDEATRTLSTVRTLSTAERKQARVLWTKLWSGPPEISQVMSPPVGLD